MVPTTSLRHANSAGVVTMMSIGTRMSWSATPISTAFSRFEPSTGMTTAVMPSMTLGSGGVGGAITGDNITVHHMYNVKRLAYELTPPPEAALRPGSTDDPSQLAGGAPAGSEALRIDEIVQKVLAELKQ